LVVNDRFFLFEEGEWLSDGRFDLDPIQDGSPAVTPTGDVSSTEQGGALDRQIVDRDDFDMVVADLDDDGADEIVFTGASMCGVAIFSGPSATLERFIAVEDEVTQDSRPLLAAPSIDPQLVELEVVTRTIFTEPIPIAAVSTPPCYGTGQDACDATVRLESCTSSGTSEEGALSVKITGGVKVTGGATTQSELAVKFSYGASFAAGSSYTQSICTEDSATEDVQGEHLVYFTVIPIDITTSTVIGPPGSELIGTTYEVQQPRRPATAGVSRDAFNDLVPSADDQLPSDILQGQVGDLTSWPATPQSAIQSSPLLIGANERGTGISLTEEQSESLSLTQSFTVEAEATVATVVFGGEVESAYTMALEVSTSQSVSMEGTIGGIDDPTNPATPEYLTGMWAQTITLDSDVEMLVADWYVSPSTP
jgi:hypothetical protein